MTETNTPPVERTKECPFCSEQIKYDAKKCKHCGETVDVALRVAEEARRASGSPQQPMVFMNAGGGGGGSSAAVASSVAGVGSGTEEKKGTKSKTTAGLLAIFLGGIGMHKFYLGKPFQGILYLVLCWTYVPAIVGLIEGIAYLTMRETRFAAKYG